MKSINLCIIFITLIFLIMWLSGCATPGDILKGFFGISTRELEDARKDAIVKIFDYDYETCYAKAEKILKDMPKISIYAQNKQMIALYYIDPNTTPVGVFFKAVDSTHTQVEIASPASTAKEWVAKNIFSETVLPAAAEAKTLR